MNAAGTALLTALWHWFARDSPGEWPSRTTARPAVRATHTPALWRKLLADRNILILSGSYFTVGYFEFIFFYWIYYYFGEIRHLGKAESAAYVTILMLTMVVMTPLGGLVSDRLVLRYGMKTGRRIVPLIGMTLSAVLLIAGASGFGTLATVVLLSLAFGFSATAEGPFWASAVDIGGPRAGAASGILNTGGNSGGILAPTLTPLFAQYFGWAGGLYFGSFMVMLGVILWFFIDAGAHQLSAISSQPSATPRKLMADS